MEPCNVFFTYVLVTAGAYALEPVGYSQDYYEDAYKLETGKPDYYPFIVGDATHPVIDYIVDEKRYYIHVGDTDEAPEGVAMDALPVQHQFLPLPYFRRTPAELATEFIKIPLPKEGPLYDAMYAVCVFFGYKTPPADASGKETKTFVIYVTYLYMLLPIRIVCGQLPNPS